MKVKYIHRQEDPTNKAQNVLAQVDIPERVFLPGDGVKFGIHEYKVVNSYDDEGVKVVIVTGKPTQI